MKPENVLLTSTDSSCSDAKVLDLGLHIRGRASRQFELGSTREESYYGGSTYDAVAFNGSVYAGTRTLPTAASHADRRADPQPCHRCSPAALHLPQHFVSVRCRLCHHTYPWHAFRCNVVFIACARHLSSSCGAQAARCRRGPSQHTPAAGVFGRYCSSPGRRRAYPCFLAVHGRPAGSALAAVLALVWLPGRGGEPHPYRGRAVSESGGCAGGRFGMSLADKVRQVEATSPLVPTASPPHTNTRHGSVTGDNQLMPISEEQQDDSAIEALVSVKVAPPATVRPPHLDLPPVLAHILSACVTSCSGRTSLPRWRCAPGQVAAACCVRGSRCYQGSSLAARSPCREAGCQLLMSPAVQFAAVDYGAWGMAITGLWCSPGARIMAPRSTSSRRGHIRWGSTRRAVCGCSGRSGYGVR